MPQLLKNKGRILKWTTECLVKSPGHTITLKRGAKPFKLTSNAQNVEYILKINVDKENLRVTRSLHDYLMDSVAEKIEKRLLPTIASVCGRRVNLQDVFMRFAFDSICKLAFGVDPVCLDPSFPTIALFDESTRLSTERFYQVHSLLWKIKRYFNVGTPDSSRYNWRSASHQLYQRAFQKLEPDSTYDPYDEQSDDNRCS
ncbi:cytochrome P450 94B3 [Selaginella moellendorffii]|uniref:cytochrome P450 94B3 n=1 Tax=Selaginella moellendorffii TaxID=88036 RepID=UPI000D1D12D5|nr:cytochrome P450 94B3 [Selaginella moellendorffii]|eukprot:XP_024536998.1 cytochrome P450 94B3 [Selaginella moellendorffii]